MKVDLGKSGVIDIAGDVLRTLEDLTGREDARQLCGIVRASFRHINAVLAQKVANPELDEVDTLLMCHLIDKPEAGLNADRLKLLLDAWEAAESSLSLSARRALQVCRQLVEAVLRSADKAAFDALSPGLVKGLDDEDAKLCAAYVLVLRDEKPASRRAAATQHYLQRRLARIRSTTVQPALDTRGRAWVDKRLTAAHAALAPVTD